MILEQGVSVKDLKSAIQDLSKLLDGFEKKTRKASSAKAGKAPSDSDDNQISELTKSNFDSLCGETTPVCIIGVFRSSKARDKLESILSHVSLSSVDSTFLFLLCYNVLICCICVSGLAEITIQATELTIWP